MKKKKELLRIGKKVYTINKELEIEEKSILAVIKGKEEFTYKIDFNSCGGVSENEFYLSKHKAEVIKQNYLNDLKFQKGDLLIFKYKEYNSEHIVIGRVEEIRYNQGTPYTIRTSFNSIYDLTDEDIVLKIENKYIENFGRLEELDNKYTEVSKELNNVLELINQEHSLLEEDLKQKFKKQFKWYNIRKKPLFKDRFHYEREDY